MSRQKTEGNLRSRVLYTRDAYNTLISALHMWGVDCSVALQTKNIDPVNSQLDVGISVDCGDFIGSDFLGRREKKLSDEDSDENEWWIPPFVADAPNIGAGQGAVNWTAGVETSDNPVLGTYQLITLDKAVAWFTNEYMRCMNKHNIAMTKRLTPGKRGRYRAMCHWVRAKVRSGVYLKLGIERLKMVCLTQRRRTKGPQIIQTRRPITAPYYTSFKFNGTHAIRLPQGRPALSKAEWLKRYMARRKARNKTDITHKDRASEVKIPEPKNGRPSRKIETEIKTNKPAVQQYESNPAFETDFEFDWSEHGRDFMEKLTEEISKGAGEQIGEWASEKLQEVLGVKK